MNEAEFTITSPVENFDFENGGLHVTGMWLCEFCDYQVEYIVSSKSDTMIGYMLVDTEEGNMVRTQVAMHAEEAGIMEHQCTSMN